MHAQRYYFTFAQLKVAEWRSVLMNKHVNRYKEMSVHNSQLNQFNFRSIQEKRTIY